MNKINDNIKELLIKHIKKKSQINNLKDEFIENRIKEYFLKNGDLRIKINKELENKGDKIIKSKIFLKIIKDIRAQIGEIYGQFLTQKYKKKEKILEKNDIHNLLTLHKSTRERINYYEKIYSQIFSWYKPKNIADLCCGFNPLSYKFMKIKPKIIAFDINPKDIEFLNIFFKKNKIKGTAYASDILTLEFMKNKYFQKCDLIFLFKALHSLEFIKKNFSKKLITIMPQKKIVVSFPTKSIKAKKEFNKKSLNWFKNLLKRQKFQYETFEIENEIFFLITK